MAEDKDMIETVDTHGLPSKQRPPKQRPRSSWESIKFWRRPDARTPENGWFKGGKMKDAMLKTLNGLRDTTPEEKEERKVDQTSLTKKEAVEAWEKWLPAIQGVVDASKAANSSTSPANP